MPATVAGVTKIRRGLYRLNGVTHSAPRRTGAPACGGRVFAEWFPPSSDAECFDGRLVRYTVPASWECYCDRCGDCDFNGWPTLDDCRREAPAFWMGEPVTPEAR